jgi:hypothetical protein
MTECKTFECGFRQCLFVGDKLAKGFRTEELPALQIEEGLTPERSRPMNLGEMRHLVPVSVMVVISSLDAAELRTKMLALQRKAHETLSSGRRSGMLGSNMWVTGDLVASNSVVQEERFFGLATIQVEVTKVVSLDA